MDPSRPSSTRPMSRIGTASRLSAMPTHRLNTSKNIGISQIVSILLKFVKSLNIGLIRIEAICLKSLINHLSPKISSKTLHIDKNSQKQ